MVAKRENKQSVYLSANVRKEMHAEAKRLNRSVSWIINFAWRHGRNEVTKLQTINIPEEEST